MTTSKAVEKFLDFSRYVRGVTPGTAKLYDYYLSGFLAVAGFHRPLGASRAAAEAFLARLGRRGVSDHVRLKAYAVLRSMFRWACDHGHIKTNPLRDTRPPIVRESPRIFLTKAEAVRLLETIRMTPREHAARDHALFSTLFFAGLRIGEAVRLRIQDLDIQGSELMVQGKGGKIARVPVHSELGKILKGWIPLRPEGSDLLFPSRAHNWQKTGQLYTVMMEKVMRQVYAPRAGMAGRVTPHTLRRSFANELRRAGVPITALQGLLRHSKIETTMKYLQQSPAELREAVEKL